MITKSLLVLVSTALLVASAFAQLQIPSDGSDGALNITSNTVIDLSQAVTGVWSNNNSANAGKGIYDPSKWAVVFKYSSVTIASNATVTFQNHASRAPVVWLVAGHVTIDGDVRLNGADYDWEPLKAPEPGPGGFRGGARSQPNLGWGSGLGPGGYHEDHGSYSTHHVYGNPQILPLIGGSGGSATGTGANGAAGGGAILIACAGTLSVNGAVHANGGAGFSEWWGSTTWGSGGAIRLIAEQIVGAGTIDATRDRGYPGRVRLEANLVSPTLYVAPPTLPVSPAPLVIWPPANAPTVRIVSVDTQAAPADPRANLTIGGADLTTSVPGMNTIILETANFPIAGTVNVYIKPRNGAQSILHASYVSGDMSVATWQLQTVLPLNHTVIQARAVAE